MNPKLRDDPTTMIVGGASLVLLLAAMLFMLLRPHPSAVAEKRKLQDRAFKAELAKQEAERTTETANAYVASHTWGGKIDEIGPTALARVTSLSKARSLNLISFRPQKPTDTSPVQIPMLATVEGPYPSVLSLSKDLETTGSRLVVTSIMISSTDATSDRVTATIGLAAFVNPSAIKPAATENVTTTKKTNA